MTQIHTPKKLVVVGSYVTGLVMDADRIPQKGETLIAQNFRSVHGGKGSNQAVQAARLGINAHFVGKVGNDVYGEKRNSFCQRNK